MKFPIFRFLRIFLSFMFLLNLTLIYQFTCYHVHLYFVVWIKTKADRFHSMFQIISNQYLFIDIYFHIKNITTFICLTHVSKFIHSRALRTFNLSLVNIQISWIFCSNLLGGIINIVQAFFRCTVVRSNDPAAENKQMS